MKLKAKSQISNDNKNVVYVINNNPPRRRRTYTKKASTSEASSGGSTGEAPINLPDNRFLNSSSLGTEIQRANLNLIENPQLRINQPNVPLLENSYDQRLLQIQDALQQQIQNTQFGMNYLYNRFDSNQPLIDEPNEEDNFGNFAGTDGSDFFVNEGDTKPDFSSPAASSARKPTPNRFDDIDTSASEAETPTIRQPIRQVSELPHILNTDFLSPTTKYAGKPSQPVINFDEVDIEEPDYSTNPQQKKKTPPPQTFGKIEGKKIQLREEYQTLGGGNTHILNSPLNHLTVKQMRDAISTQHKLNDKKTQYKANGGKNLDVLNSQNIKIISDATKALIKQNNAQKKR